MSRAKTITSENFAFVERLIEVCGSSEPVRIQRLLNISYPTARNYLDGRLPHASVLKVIAERTPYSLNWLLTGRGKKFAESSSHQDTLISAGQIEAFVRKICVEVINEMVGSQQTAAQSKVVVLQSDKLKTEKVMEESVSFPGKQP